MERKVKKKNIKSIFNKSNVEGKNKKKLKDLKKTKINLC
jgi:hypothetical protein